MMEVLQEYALVLSPGFGVLLNGPNKKYFDGTFIEYAENTRSKNQREGSDT